MLFNLALDIVSAKAKDCSFSPFAVDIDLPSMGFITKRVLMAEKACGKVQYVHKKCAQLSLERTIVFGAGGFGVMLDFTGFCFEFRDALLDNERFLYVFF